MAGDVQRLKRVETKHVPSGCPHLHADAINCNVSRICLGPTSISLSIVCSENRETLQETNTHIHTHSHVHRATVIVATRRRSRL